MRLNDFAFLPWSDDREDYRDHIAKASITESWGEDNRYLQVYVGSNFELAYDQGKVKEDPTKRHVLWRVGNLTTREGEPISILCTKNRQTGKQPYFYARVFDQSRFQVRFEGEVFDEAAPPAVDYLPPDYHPEYALKYNFSHYLEDHADRAAETFPRLNDHQRFLCIYAALNLSHKRWMHTSVSQWWHDKNSPDGTYQWLLPLHINSEDISDKPDLVATLEPYDDQKEYYVRTLLPPDWAYPHARAVSVRDPQFRSWASGAKSSAPPLSEEEG